MYLGMLIATFVILPILSTIIDVSRQRKRGSQPDVLFSVARWFTFWIVGVRLFIAGAMQALNPGFTAETIFGTADAAVLPFVSELGYANLAFGVIGLISGFRPSWVMAAATAGAVFLGLDGLRHVIEGGDFTVERILAMVSDLIALIMLGGSAILLTIRGRKRIDDKPSVVS